MATTMMDSLPQSPPSPSQFTPKCVDQTPPGSPGSGRSPKMRRKVSLFDETESASQRLVEYFVVISSIPRFSTTNKKQGINDCNNDKKRTEQIKSKTTTKQTKMFRNKTPPKTPRSSNRKKLGNNGNTNPKAQPDERCDADTKRDRTETKSSPSATIIPRNANIHLQNDENDNKNNDNDNDNNTTQYLSDCTFQPQITTRFPTQDYQDHAFNPMLAQFCYPNSDIIHPSLTYVMPRIHHFVLTNDKGRKVYGTCLTVYEEFHAEEGSPFFLNRSTVHDDSVHSNFRNEDGSIEVTSDNNNRYSGLIYVPKVLCILSIYPYLTAFREYITQLYRLATSTNMMTTPIERYITNLCREIPAPPPGAFEIQVPILNSVIRFWAPPAKLPVAYVALPYQTLFDCLDVDNILRVWYALVLERKVLLLSSQASILTIVAEILCSLLFPLQWSHLYIPLVPKFLSPMLDAPIPYLCGIHRDNWMETQHHVSDETIVVDLDRNKIIVGENMPDLPTIPRKKFNKLNAALYENAGELYWEARGLEKEHRQLASHKMSQIEFDQLLVTGEARWNEKLQMYDEAIHLAYTPTSPNLLNDGNDINSSNTGGSIASGHEQSQWDKIQESFLRFFVSILKDYRKYLISDTSNGTENDANQPSKTSRWKEWSFDHDRFINAQKKQYRDFLTEFCMTQQFDDFITKRLYNKGEPYVKFFDQSIDAKLNRSKLKVKKLDTPFLQSARAHKVLNIVQAVEPNSEGLPKASSSNYLYKNWPDALDSELFGKPRPIPKMITAEFDRQSALVDRLRANNHQGNMLDDDLVDLYVSYYDPSPEVAAFTVFFMTYSEIIGREWQQFVEKRISMEMKGEVFSDTDDTEFDEARAVAKSQLDLAFDVLGMMNERDLPSPDPEALKGLMGACGRCGDHERATQLMEMIRRDGLFADGEMYSCFMKAFCQEESATDGNFDHVPFTSLGDDESTINSTGTDAYSKYLKKRLNLSRSTGSITPTTSTVQVDDDFSSTTSGVSDMTSELCTPTKPYDLCPVQTSSGIADCYNMITLALFGDQFTEEKPTKPKKKKKKRRKKKMLLGKPGDCIVTDSVRKQVDLGETLLEFLYPDLAIDMNSDACPLCSKQVSDSDIIEYFSPCEFQDLTTRCPDCNHRFVSKFSVHCNGTDFIGSQGVSTPLYCEFLSPWILIKELRRIINGEGGIEDVICPEWRSGTDINAVLFWNMVLYFMKFRLPVSFLLQGSFQNRLINPDPLN